MGSDRFAFGSNAERMSRIDDLGDNNARVLYYELQYNTSFQQNDWISVPVEQRRESYTEIKSQDGSIKLEPMTTSQRRSLLVSLSLTRSFVFSSFPIDTSTVESIRFTDPFILLGQLYLSCHRIQSCRCE